ncbi:MAG: ETC complex I subunit [Salaquimonas sp.]
MIARIYSPAKTAMQSGNAKTGAWVLEFEREKPRRIEPLMGYTSSSDMNSQVKMEFPTLEAAKAFADKEGFAYRIQPVREAKRRRPMTYAENFSYNRNIPWTH